VTSVTGGFDDRALPCTTLRTIAIDVGGSHLRCGLVGHEGILRVFDHPISPGSRLAPLLQVLEHQVADLARNADCRAIAISFPGIVTRDGKVLSTPRGKFEDAPDIDLAGWAKARFGLRLIMENDARMALLGECAAGAAQNCPDVLIVMLGSGVGSAVMIHGALLRGAHYQAGCLGGHIPARFDGRLCICGAIGCVEAEASTWALDAIARELHALAQDNLPLPSQLDFATVFRRSAAGDSFMTEVRDHCLNVWSAGIVGLIHAYDPSVVVLGGGVMASADQIIPVVSSYIERHAFTWWGKPQLRTAKLGPDAALIGAWPLLQECL
jgi:glucokinase